MSIAEELAGALDPRMIGDLAGPAVYERGVGYWEDGRVQSVVEEEGRLRATVRGSMPYAVELWFEGDELLWSCSCPAAENGSFCKHCTAVALTLLYADIWPDDVDASKRDRDSGGTHSTDDDSELLEGFVRRLDPERLTDIVLSQLAGDWRLREQLLLEARSERGLGPDMAQWRERIDSAFATGGLDRWGYPHYRDPADWADSVNEVIDALDDLAAAGHHQTAAELASHAYIRADVAMGEVDDSDGRVTSVTERLAHLHLQACEDGSPDPAALAQRLAKLELSCELDHFIRSAATYAHVLGPAGLAAFHEIVEPKWLKIDPSPEGDPRQRDYRRDGIEFQLRQAMIGWALATGDPDALVEAHRSERIAPHATLEIARAYEAAGRHDEAVEWARTGLSGYGHGSWHSDDLRDFLARKLRERGEDGPAIDLYWNAFTASPSQQACRTLLAQDRRPSAPDWLERCLTHLRSRLGPSSSAVSSPPGDVMASNRDEAPSAAVVLAEILLYEGRRDEAWQVALEHGTSKEMWMKLALAREQTAPRESIAIYESEALAIIGRKRPNDYRHAVDLLARIRRLADEADEPALFDPLLHHVRTAHKPKRRLQSELGEMKPLAPSC